MRITELMTTPAITVLGETTVSEADLIPDTLLVEDRVPSYPLRLSAVFRPRRVAELMTHLVMSVRSDEDIDGAIDLLREAMAKSLPVVEREQVVGVISRSDLIHYLAGRDARIRNDILDLLRERELDWKVEVDDGIVRILGTTGELDRQRAESIAGSVAGVIAVHAP